MAKRCKLGKDYETSPSYGYYASQGSYYYGYKLHAICGLSGVIHSYDLTKAVVHDINYLKDVKWDYHDCSIFGDRGYISKSVQLVYNNSILRKTDSFDDYFTTNPEKSFDNNFFNSSGLTLTL